MQFVYHIAVLLGENMQNIGFESKDKRSVTITLTEACNLNCTYCYENHKSKHKLSIDTFKEIIKK